MQVEWFVERGGGGLGIYMGMRVFSHMRISRGNVEFVLDHMRGALYKNGGEIHL